MHLSERHESLVSITTKAIEDGEVKTQIHCPIRDLMLVSATHESTEQLPKQSLNSIATVDTNYSRICILTMYTN